MRYEDTSGTLGSAGTPEARDDADKLLANSNAPATGNVITGAGTTTGKEGADTPQTGHVVSVRGAGGTDTSDSGQTLHVEGRYGTLSMDEHGNYRYVPEARHPNDVRDLFQYTLATAKGQSTADLVIELGGGAVKVNANAQQIVPGPDGVVTLPAGVDLSDVHVVGRNLVVNLPDGSQIVIVDGAVFVPQLVVGGVELPSTNLAALLIDAEPKPAAGSSQSSGGNFEVPVPPLDPGTPLGDLIPPVEMHFQPPEFIPVGQFINHEPTIEIQPDNQPASVAAVDEVNEKGLPTRNGGEPAGTGEIADGNGSNNSDTTETTAGTIIIDSQDGIGSVTINGVLVTGAVGQTISGAFGTLTITGFSGQNILYSYTLADNTSGDNTHDDFSVTVTDSDGDQASATLTIDIIDDQPIARDDTDAVVKPSNSTDGNVLTGANTTSGAAGADTPGADDLPNGVTGIHPGTSGTFTDVTSGGVLVHGTFGDLVIHSDGSYTYTVTVNGSPGGNDVFTYEITDGDGDVDTATLTITVPADSIPVAANATAFVDDEGLAGGIPGGSGDEVQNPDPDNDESTFSGTVTANFGGDGPGTFAFGSGVNGSSATIGQEQVTYHVVGGVLTAEITSSPDAGRVGTDLFTVTLNSDGTYTVQLLENVLHPTLDGQTGDNTENNVSAAITFTATDSDGDTGNGTLTINFDDDIPTASNEQVTGTVDEDGVPGGIAGGVGDVAGEDTVATGSVAAMFNSGADQPLSYSLLTDTSGLPALTSGGLTVHYSVSGNTLTAYTGATPADGVVFTLTVASNGNYTFTLLDQLDHPSLDGQVGDNTENDLNLALGSIVQATDADGDSVAGNSNGLVITVDDDTPTATENQVTGTVDEDGVPGGIAGGVGDVAGENTVATGNVSGLFNSGADAPLSYNLLTDTSGLPALTSAGLAVHYSVSGNTLTAYTGATPADGVVFTFSVNASTGAYTFTLVDQLDHPTLNGLPGDDTENDLNIDLSSIVQATDADGDSVSAATGGIVIIVDDDTPVANNDVDSTGAVGTTATGNILTGVDHSGGDANTTDGVADQFGADQPGSIIGLVGFGGSTDTNPSGGFDVLGQYGTLHIDANGDYTYTRTGGPGGATDTFTYTIQDFDGDKTTATLTITLGDSQPVATTATATVDDDGLAGGIPGGPGDDDANAGESPPSASEATWNGTLGGSGGDAPTQFLFSTSMNGTTDTVGQETVTYSVSGAAPAGFGTVLTATITGGARDGTVLYTVTITDTATGAYTVQLLDNVLHPTLDGVSGDNTENNVSVTVDYQMRDSDGDTSASPGQLTINFDDDTPTTTATLLTGTVDEDGVPGGIAGGTGDVAGEITVATGNVSGLFNSGADAPLSYSLLTNTSGLPSLTSGGLTVHYSVSGNTLTAYTGATPADGVVFTFSVNSSTGAYTFTLVDQLDHPTLNGLTGDNTENDLTISLGSIIQATDADGDSVTAAANGLVITVDDDTPTTTANTVGGTVDEDGLTGGIAGGTGDVAGEAVVATGSVTTLFNSGADAPLSYSLLTNTSGLPALTSGGLTVHYSVSGNTLTAYTGANPSLGQVFTLTLNSNGSWTFTLLGHLDHATGNNENDLTIDFSSIVSATDADGDSITAAASGLVITVDDDSPVNFTPVHLTDTTHATVTTQDDALANDGTANVTRLINDSNNDGTGENFIGADGFGSLVFTATGHTNGEQLLDASSNPLTSGGDAILVTGFGTSTLTAYADVDGSGTINAGDTVVFTATLSTGSGFGSASTYTIDFNQAIDNGGGISFNDLTSTSAGNVNYRGVGADDAGTPVDLLLSASAGGATATVNTDSDSIGSANQSMDAGETVRIDFVSNLTSGAATTTGFGFTGHVSSNDFFGEIPQVQGAQSETVAFTVYALDSTLTQSGTPDNNPTGGFNDATITHITDVTVQDYLTGNTTTMDVSAFEGDNTFHAIAYGISVRVNADGSVTFSGIQEGDHYGFHTDGGDFNAVVVQSNVAGTGGSTEDSFDLGVFAIGVTSLGDPIDLALGVTATDADGDTSTGTINLTLAPVAPPVVLDLNGDGVQFLGTDAGVHYDYGSGLVATAWASPQDGILAFDGNHNGTVDSASEFVFGGNGVTDLQALAAYDSNGDGQLSAADAQFSSFVVWQDANSNGVADAGEVNSLTALGITSISLSSDGISYTTANGDVSVSGTGSYTKADGSTGSLADAAFVTGSKTTSTTDDLKASTSLASNAALIAAVAAAGLAAEGQATAAAHANIIASLAANGDAPAHNEALAPIALDSVSGGASSLMPTISNDSAQDSAQSAASHASDAGQSNGLSVAGDAPSGQAPTELPQGTQAPSGGGADNASATAASIVMPSASQLAGVNGVDGAQHNQVVGQVLADALHGGTGGNAIDALINSLPSHEGVNSATDALATHAGSAVPNVDIAALAGFISAHTGLMEQMVVHQVVAAPHA